MDKEKQHTRLLRDLEEKNRQYQQELQEKQEILLQKEAQRHQLRQQLNVMERQFNTMKNNKIWHLLRKLKRLVKVALAYATGRRNIRQLLRSTKQKNADKQIKRLKYKLYEQGFTTKALEELEFVYQKSDNRILRRQAAWELALWHANKYTKEAAEVALTYVNDAKKGLKGKKKERRAAILEAECLELLGKQDKGKSLLLDALKTEEHADLYFALANQEKSGDKKLKWINKALGIYEITPISVSGDDYTYDHLRTEPTKETSGDIPKVSIIIPVFNAEDGVQTAIESIQKQTWKNIEILVVDDCSTDQTVQIVQSYAEKDERIKLISTGTNSGPYVARNIALKEATGDFVTINDADDWSHAEKIESQARHLMEHPSVIANTSQQARLTEDLNFYRRGKPGEYIFANLSSLMFRRKPVMEKLGFWDCVRFGADGEFKKRLKKVFGPKTVVDLQQGPYSFQRQSSGSLTGSEVFGYHGFFMGARKEYAESYQYHHENTQNLYYTFPMEKRPYPIPEPMWPNREEKDNGVRQFDVVIASEFRLLGGTNMSNIEEIKAQKKMGLRTGLVQMNRYDLNSTKEINPKVRDLIDGEQVQMLVYGEKITCDVLIIRHPPVLQHWQKYIPEIEAHNVRVIVNQPPKREYSAKGKTLYELKDCAKNIQSYFGKIGKWYPIGPSIREALVEHHEKELKWVNLAPDDWVNIIDINEWNRGDHKTNNPIRIGRHSRDQYVKWPSDKEELLKVYPNSSKFEIHVLGGAKAPTKVLGSLPSNWQVYEFGDMEPREFLKTLDVFVYYTHPDWVEAFGRVIFEAMAAGVPVIIDPSYKELFGEAAIYAEPKEVQKKIDELVHDEEYYQSQVDKALNYVEERFGYTKHAQRLEECIIDRKLI